MPPPVWFSFEGLPPGNNHMYANNGRGGKVLTKEARAARESIGQAAEAAGFRLNPAAVYVVRLVFIFPKWGQDCDSPVKATLDAIFTPRWDHRVVRLEVDKQVEPGVRYTEVEITEMVAPMRSRERAVVVTKTSYRSGKEGAT